MADRSFERDLDVAYALHIERIGNAAGRAAGQLFVVQCQRLPSGSLLGSAFLASGNVVFEAANCSSSNIFGKGLAVALSSAFIRSGSSAEQVNDLQARSSASAESFDRGETIDIADVMLSREKASVGFQATLQVRNKLLSAYKDIMSMPV